MRCEGSCACAKLSVRLLLMVMGGRESAQRRVSYTMDEEERVRVLRGVRLSDDVVSRMKDPKEEKPPAASGIPPSPSAFPSRVAPAATIPDDKARGHHQQTAGGEGRPTSETEEDLYRRYEREQALIQEELLRLAERERQAAQAKLSSSIMMEKNYTNQERRRAENLAQELERKEVELKRLDAFHKEQLANIEKKNLEIYRMTAEQYHTAATNAELRVKKRSYDPVCLDLQSNILKCYKENSQERLTCSDLAKEYRRCVSAAQKELLFNHG